MFLRKPTLFSTFLLFSTLSFSQIKVAAPAKPKLVIGIVVDQMRWDYLYRFEARYKEGGFKRLLNQGFSCDNTHINYSPAYTAPGHTCIYTGSVPAIHGMTGNAWYERAENKVIYCAEDTTVSTVGSGTKKAGAMSPKRMQVTTVTDELRFATNFESKVIGIAIKDRGAILPAGHAANGAYWYDGKSGNWITSTYYRPDLPKWAGDFNGLKKVEQYLAMDWVPMRPKDWYAESTVDYKPYEGTFSNEDSAIFPHRVSGLLKKNFDIISTTPFGNTMTLDFAKEAIKGEHLGMGKATDFLAISLSSTDYVGHQFGPNSVEIEDTYLGLDDDLSAFLTFLDNTVGKGQYLLFLSADHGAAHVPDFMKEHHTPAGVIDMDSTLKMLNGSLQNSYGSGDWILPYENMQIAFDHSLMMEKKVDVAAFKRSVKSFMMNQNGITNVVDLENLANETLEESQKKMIANGYYPTRCGDVQIILNPAWLEGKKKGTSHGTFYAYDTHIPLLWYGWNIHQGKSSAAVNMTDIAPTISALLHIQEPSGNVGKPIESIIK